MHGTKRVNIKRQISGKSLEDLLFHIFKGALKRLRQFLETESPLK